MLTTYKTYINAKGGAMDERKLRILNAIIKSYTESKEPVGSRTLSKDSSIGVSAATIRNEMSDLEDLGYLVKVHSSSGRVPSSRGYRLYVDALLSDQVPFRRPKNELVDPRGLEYNNEFESIISNGIKMLSAITNYAAFAVMPQSEVTQLQYINVVMLNPRELAVIYIYNTKEVRHQIINLHTPVNQEVVSLINRIFNATLLESHPAEILDILDSHMYHILMENNQTLSFIVPQIEAQVEKLVDRRMLSEGLGNIYRFNQASLEENERIINFINDQGQMQAILCDQSAEDLQIRIGEEIGIEEFNNFSIVSMTFKNESGHKGRIAVLGPVAMAYDKVISDILIVTRYINNSISRKE